MIRNGEIYTTDFAGGKRRPVLVVSRNSLNRGKYVTIVPFTTARLAERRDLLNCVFFRAGEFGLTADCVAQCEAVAFAPINRLDATPLGRVDDGAMHSVMRAIGYVIEADCEPA